LVRGVPQALFKRGGGSVFLGGGDPFHIEFSSKLLWRANYHLNRPNYTKNYSILKTNFFSSGLASAKD
jgi:hypothetical protein